MTNKQKETSLDQVDYIKIPRDFKSLGDLKELMQNYKFMCRLHDALDEYQECFVRSFLMDMDEVLKYINISELHEYSLNVGPSRVNGIGAHEHFNKTQMHITGSIIEDLCYVNVKNLKMYMVDTIHKSIDIHPWVKPKLYNKFQNLDYAGTKFDEIPVIQVFAHRNTIRLYSQYSYKAYDKIGGSRIMCATGHSYMIGGTDVEVTKHGAHVYEFCTETNSYLGYVKPITDN